MIDSERRPPYADPRDSPADAAPAFRSPGTARLWGPTGGVAAIAAAVMLAMRTDIAITIAGVLAAAAAVSALAVARLRRQRPDTADVVSVIAAALVLAAMLLILLGAVVALRPQR